MWVLFYGTFSCVTGDVVALTGKYVPHFKPGKELRERVNVSAVVATKAKGRTKTVR